MKIAVFDIDDTITYETTFMLEKATEFLHKHNLDAEPVNLQGYNLGEVFGLKKQLIDKGMSVYEAEEMERQLISRFWNKYFITYNFRRFRPDVKTVINTLKGYGYDIHFLSLRGKRTKKVTRKNEFVRKKVIPMITKVALWKNGITYDKLTLVSTEQEKLEYIKYYHPQIIFDDQLFLLKTVSKETLKICVDTPHNSISGLDDEIHRITNFKDSLVIFKEYLDDDVLVNEKKKFDSYYITNTLQILAKTIAGWYFVKKYQPIVIGKEKIPNRGGIAFVGNHRNKLDPVFITITAGKTIQWAALLRMFQGKEALFSLKKNKLICTLSAKFITLMGALPIARPEDENFEKVNICTINKLTEILNQKHSIGFFPEGTINRTPEKANTLPLKSNRIFRMATETDSYVQPVSVVWIPEKYQKKSRLVIIYSYPINTYRRNKKEVRDIWQETIKKNIEYAKEMIEQYDDNKRIS